MASYNKDWNEIAGFNFVRKTSRYPNDMDTEDFIQSLINDRNSVSTSTSISKGTENHLGEIEDVKQPLILDPSLDF